MTEGIQVAHLHGSGSTSRCSCVVSIPALRYLNRIIHFNKCRGPHKNANKAHLDRMNQNNRGCVQWERGCLEQADVDAYNH